MQMILLCILLSSFFLPFGLWKVHFFFFFFFFRDKQEGMCSFSVAAGRGLLSTWERFLLIAFGLLGESTWELKGVGGLVLICRAGGRRSGWAKLVWLHECLPPSGRDACSNPWPRHLAFYLCFLCDEFISSTCAEWMPSQSFYFPWKVRAAEHTGSAWLSLHSGPTSSSLARKASREWIKACRILGKHFI